MSIMLNELSVAINEGNEVDVIKHLNAILSQGLDLDITIPDRQIPRKIIAIKNEKITQLFLEAAAEWCKQEQNRKIFTHADIINWLFTLLEKSESDESQILSVIRVLGNICYDNEDARKLIDEKQLSYILDMLKADSERQNNLLTMKVSGFLLNLLMNNDALQKAALRLNICNIIETILVKYIHSFKENQMMFAFLLTVVYHIIDFFEEENIPFSESFCCTIIEVFKQSFTPDLSVLCLQILHAQSDKDNIKMILARKGVCDLIFELIEIHQSELSDEENQSVLKMACDLIVVILTEDESMNLLFDEGNGIVFKNMVRWLDSSNMDLLSTGVLAIGNFARKDAHCVKIVENGISRKLLSLLSQYNKPDSDIKVQHALLSTLKNLAIPQQNKSKLLEEGIINVIYPLIEINQYLVIFKLLGTFRMIIDGQEAAALDLISRREFLEKLLYWCYNSDHLGVRGEIPRLLSWLIKNCHSFKPLKTFLQVQDAVKCLVEMMSSNHAVMQNESFYALALLCRGCSNYNITDSEQLLNDSTDLDIQKYLFDKLITADIGKNLYSVIDKYGNKMDKPTIENLLTLLEQLTSTEIESYLKLNKVGEALNTLLKNDNAATLQERFHQITSRLT